MAFTGRGGESFGVGVSGHPHTEPMTDTDHRILALEARTFRSEEAKQSAVHHELGMTATRYYQRLGRLIRDPQVIAEYPMLAKRVGRVMNDRAWNRSKRAIA